MKTKPNIIKLFLRYNVVAIIATVVDFCVFVLLNNVLNFWYVGATFTSAVIGGVTAFTLNRNWVFNSIDKKIKFQIAKYILVWGGSIFLNTYGLYLFVENTNISVIISKIIITVFVGISYNFLMSKFFIFK